MRIYVTEDSPTQIVRVRKILSELKDTTVSFFSDGLEAYIAICKDPPDLLLLDLILPTLHGLALCRLLKYHETLRAIPVIIFSSITETDIDDQVFEVGADAFLPKPFTPEQLLTEIARHTASAQGV